MIIFQNSPREFPPSRRVNQGHQGRPLCGSWMGLMASSMISFLGVLISPTKKASHDLGKWGKPSRISVVKMGKLMIFAAGFMVDFANLISG